jgi:MFS family permease
MHRPGPFPPTGIIGVPPPTHPQAGGGRVGNAWVIDAYALALAALLLGLGSAADLVGRRRVYLLGTLAPPG